MTKRVAFAGRPCGFTLIEVLVALSIMAVLATMAWQGIDGMARSRDVSNAAVEGTLRINTTLAQWERDLQSLQDTGSVPPLRFDGATLRLTRTTDDGVQLVAWSLRDGAWWRWASPAFTRAADLQDAWLGSQQLLGNEPGTLRVLGDTSAVQVYFYRGSGWSNAQSSGDVAPTGSAVAGTTPVVEEQLPTGIRLVLSLAGGTLTRDLVLPSQPPS